MLRPWGGPRGHFGQQWHVWPCRATKRYKGMEARYLLWLWCGWGIISRDGPAPTGPGAFETLSGFGGFVNGLLGSAGGVTEYRPHPRNDRCSQGGELSRPMFPRSGEALNLYALSCFVKSYKFKFHKFSAIGSAGRSRGRPGGPRGVDPREGAGRVSSPWHGATSLAMSRA